MSRIWSACKGVPQYFGENRTAKRLLSIAIYGTVGSFFYIGSGLRPPPRPRLGIDQFPELPELPKLPQLPGYEYRFDRAFDPDGHAYTIVRSVPRQKPQNEEN